MAAAAGVEPLRDGDQWMIGSLRIGPTQRTADVLTRAHTAEEIRRLVTGPSEAVELAAVSFGR